MIRYHQLGDISESVTVYQYNTRCDVTSYKNVCKIYAKSMHFDVKGGLTSFGKTPAGSDISIVSDPCCCIVVSENSFLPLFLSYFSVSCWWFYKQPNKLPCQSN